MPGHPKAEFRRHRTLTGEFAPGAAIAQAGFIRQLIPVWNASRVRIRFEASVSGNLRASIPLPGIVAGELVDWPDDVDAQVLSADSPVETVVVAANTEVVLELGTAGNYELCGEAYILLEFQEDNLAAGTVTKASCSQHYT